MISPQDTVLITGCGGMLGEGVYQTFVGKCHVVATDIDLNAPWLSYLDVRDPKAIAEKVAEVNPQYIIHLAALTDMEQCERELENAYRTNAMSTVYLSREAAKRNIPFLYISTAGIFDGEKETYTEEDIPNPLSVYGQTKYFGEVAALNVPKSTVIRAGWMMGGGPSKDKKFINKIIKQIRAGKTELSVVTDKLGTPCYTYDLARSIYFLLDNGHTGIYHGACEGSASRFEVAAHLLELLGLADRIKLTQVDSDFFKTDYFAPRPVSEKLINARLKQVNPDLTRDWNVCLKEYIEKFDWDMPS